MDGKQGAKHGQWCFRSRRERARGPRSRQDFPLAAPCAPAASAKDGSFAFIYSPRGESFTVDKSVITAPRMREIWYDPRHGVAYDVHTTSSRGIQTYTPPTSGRGQDWLLIIEDVTKSFPLPGMPKK